jgi:hypothetical protein
MAIGALDTNVFDMKLVIELNYFAVILLYNRYREHFAGFAL